MQTKTKQQAGQEKRLQKNIKQANKTRADVKAGSKSVSAKPPQKKGGFFASMKRDAPQTVQQTIPYREMYRDGICRVDQRLYTKTVQFYDINYQLAQNDDKTQIFESYCDFLNYFDASITVQLTFVNQRANMRDFVQSIDIPARGDAFDDVRREYGDMLKGQLAKGNNGLVKQKYITFGIEADNPKMAKMRLERVEADILANFKSLGVTAHTLNGQERLAVLHGQFHPDGREKLRFAWGDLAKTGMSTKDFIAPSGMSFSPDGRYFRVGGHIGAASFVQILAPELTDRMLADFLDMDSAVTVNLHIQSIDQSEAIKKIKRKMSDLQKMTIEEQKKAVRAGYDMDIIPTDLATYGEEAKSLLTDLQSRNERLFLVTIIIQNIAKKRQKLENDVFAASGIAQKFNCALKRLDHQQEQGLMSSLPLGKNQIEIQRSLTTSSTAIFVPFTTCELFQTGEALYYGLNALSNNLLMANRKELKNPKGLYCKRTGIPPKTQAGKPFAAQMDGQPRERSSGAVGHRATTVGKIISEVFKNSSDLPPVFLLLVRECNRNNPVLDYTPAASERRLTHIVYTHQTENSILKGAKTMQTTITGAAQPKENAEPPCFTKRIGSTVYAVSVHFSRSSTETIEDKILKLMESEVRKTA